MVKWKKIFHSGLAFLLVLQYAGVSALINFPQIARAVSTAIGGSSGASYIGKTDYVQLSDLIISASQVGDMNAVEDIVISDNGGVTGSSLQFDVSASLVL
ncbi:MAG: hypothetical protein CEN91_41, partial [Candidatus Berkelbacteria bacterium Licking1014_85]